MRREPLLDVLDFAATRNPAQRYQFLPKVMTLVRSGQVTLYGELGSSTSLGPIPVEYFNSHKLTWLNGIGVRTLDPKKTPKQSRRLLLRNLRADITAADVEFRYSNCR
jgi:hypothetical protein